ncbi:MAG: hypothetical protein IJ083_00090 [Clostridia bacterium]|nr:hypothetical protein [Clostridia bacterium]
MPAAYYTTVTRNQVNVLYWAQSSGQIHLTRRQTDFLYAFARQGGGFVTDPVEEDFRQRIRQAVNLVATGKNEEADALLEDAFRLACASWESEALTAIRAELENRTQASKAEQLHL